MTATVDGIRAAEPHDISELSRLMDAVALFPSELLVSMLEEHFRSDRDDGAWFVDVMANEIAGVAYVALERMTSSTWNLLLIAVHPSHQGTGRGRALTTYVEDYARRANARILLVETSGTQEFERTRAVYHALGYELEGRIRDYYDDGDDKVVFRKSLKRAATLLGSSSRETSA